MLAIPKATAQPAAIDAATVPPALEVRNLRVEVPLLGCDLISDISFAVAPGSTLALVGESGSGKSTIAKALLGYCPPGLHIQGSVIVDGTDVLSLEPQDLQGFRGRKVSYVAQDPSTALTPTMRIGEQIAECIAAHRLAGTRADLEQLVGRALERAQLPSTRDFRRRYPFQLSGGQQQRVVIALALACDPSVVIMDEPTTALDVTTQARLLTTIREICKGSRKALVYVTHDLAVVRQLADEVLVLYSGRTMERAGLDALFRRPEHPYTRRLLSAVPRGSDDNWTPTGIGGHAVEPWRRPPGCAFTPRCSDRQEQCSETVPTLRVVAEDGRWVACHRAGRLPAGAAETAPAPVSVPDHADILLKLSGVAAGYATGFLQARQFALSIDALHLRDSECLAVVGESGSGKSTLLRCLAGLHEWRGGQVSLLGAELPARARDRSLEQLRSLQLIPQNPYSSLNPRHSICEILLRPVRKFQDRLRADAMTEVRALLEAVGLPVGVMGRRANQLSGGERQRVAIARALAANPRILLCDEITAALDVSVQANILNLLAELRRERGLAIIFVSHDLAVVRGICDRVIVMKDGSVQEAGTRQQVFTLPAHPYTRELLTATPKLMPGDYPGRTGAP